MSRIYTVMVITWDVLAIQDYWLTIDGLELWIWRLNFGILMIFEPSERNLNLNASDCRASKILPNETKLEAISWELVFGNPIFNFCVGVEGRWTWYDKLVIWIKRCAKKHIFWYQFRRVGRQSENGFKWKTDQKSKMMGVEIAESENLSTNLKSLENLFSNQDNCPASSFVSDIRCISIKNIKCSINGHISFSY